MKLGALATNDAPEGDLVALGLDVAMSPILLSGVYAWSITVAPAFSLVLRLFDVEAKTGPGSWLAVPFAALALVPVIVGAALRRKGAAVAPIVGVWGFLACSLLSWLFAPGFIDVAHLDPTRGFLGSMGFALYALAWGTPRTTFRRAPEEDPRADLSAKLDARDRLPKTSLFVASVGVVTAAGLVYLAFRPTEGPRSLVAHGLAGALSVAALGASATIAVARPRYVAATPKIRLSRATTSILLLTLLLGGGVAYLLGSR